MIPVMCRVKHAPDEGKWGDCARACIASLLDIEDGEGVPHFYDNDADGETGMRAIRDYLATLGYVPFWSVIDGSASLEEVLTYMEAMNPTVHYMLNGAIDGGDHVMICRGGKIVHDPNWLKSPFIGPASSGHWVAMVIARA